MLFQFASGGVGGGADGGVGGGGNVAKWFLVDFLWIVIFLALFLLCGIYFIHLMFFLLHL